VRKPKQIESADDGKAEVLRAKSSPKVFTAEIKEKAKHAEAQMLQLMENNEFTRALNQYRSFERAGQDALFTEELFSAFAHSATRVGKVDVTDRMLRAMKRAGITPSLEFWQHTMKLLSSRKHFGACLSMYDLWPRQCPADKTVLSARVPIVRGNGLPHNTSCNSMVSVSPPSQWLFCQIRLFRLKLHSLMGQLKVVFTQRGRIVHWA